MTMHVTLVNKNLLESNRTSLFDALLDVAIDFDSHFRNDYFIHFHELRHACLLFASDN